jgi:hypothetical protein
VGAVEGVPQLAVGAAVEEEAVVSRVGARRHHRGAFFAYGFAAPYFYDDSWPYYSSYYGDNGCWAVRYIRGAYRRVWVCY